MGSRTGNEISTQELRAADYILIAFSGGKDSTACVLHTLERLGLTPETLFNPKFKSIKEKVILLHNDIDGKEGSTLMDWPVTPDYCQKFADALGLRIFHAWKVNGFEGEMLRNNSLSNDTKFEALNGEIITVTTKSKPGTRLQFPQVSADLSVRWCSAYLKIDVASKFVTNQPEIFGGRKKIHPKGVKIIYISGERAEESSARAKYKVVEPHAKLNSKSRPCTHWRPIHSWLEKEVWDIIQKWKINPHPAYRLGWGRLSCAACIFGSKNQWASLNAINPEQVKTISCFEKKFGKTIHRKKAVDTRIEEGTVYESLNEKDAALALAKKYTDTIFVTKWELPAGAFGESCGPS